MRSTTSAPGFKAFATSERTVAGPFPEAIVLAFFVGFGAFDEVGAFQAFGCSPSSSSYNSSHVEQSWLNPEMAAWANGSG